MTQKVWILTFEVNNYDQEGAYFLAAFAKLPSLEELAKFMRSQDVHFSDVMEAVAFLEHLRKGGGRRDTENRWYNLEQVDLK